MRSTWDQREAVTVARSICIRKATACDCEWRSISMVRRLQWCTTGKCHRPILFVMFINDMPDNITNFVSLFADDTKLFGKSTTAADSEAIQHDLHKLQEWTEIWNLKFNKEKMSNTLPRKEQHKTHLQNGVPKRNSVATRNH